ncbi:MAG: hypothetical protein LBH10_01045 [Burkholderiaceae bacterium]|nr:hypothetical protein [Burkholderiaceae bacterium]
MSVRACFSLGAMLIFASALTTASANADAATAKTAKKSQSHSVKFIKNPNQETTTERERRLKRECKGMPNAGACLGYANN